MWETWVQSLGWEDPMEKEMATHSSILAMDEGAWWARVHRSQRVRHNWATSHSLALLLGRKAVTNLDNLLKSRNITLPTNVHLVKAMFFLVVLYGCESGTIKKAEYWRNDAFELWCWRRLLRVSWTARRSNQPNLKEISPEYSLEGLMLKLKLWPPDAKKWLFGKDPDAGKDWRQEEEGTTEVEMVGQHHWFNVPEFE